MVLLIRALFTPIAPDGPSLAPCPAGVAVRPRPPVDATLAAAMEAGAERALEGAWEEALAHYERALRLAPRGGSAADVAEILRRIGMVHRDRRDLDLAAELFEASLEIARLNGLATAEGRALISAATVASVRGDLEEAERRYREARELGARTGDGKVTALADQNLGTVAFVRGDLPGAMERYAAALEYHEPAGDHVLASQVLNNQAMVHAELGAWEEAERCYERASEAARRARSRPLVGHIELNRAELHVKRGALPEASEACERAFSLFRGLGHDSGCSESHKIAGVVCREAGDLDGAHRHFVEAVRLAHRCEETLQEGQALREWARVYLKERRNADALRRLNEAHRLLERVRARRDLVEVERNLDALEESYLVVVRAWGESVESKDRHTAGHCERVAGYACLLARAVGVEGRDLTGYRMGGYLHDVGKTTIPEEALNRPGPLSAAEWEAMRRHPLEGDALVAELEFPWEIRPMVRSHHERWDGAGYPDGLKGEEIPLSARILCVADVYDALTSTRSYRAALTWEEAIRTMRADAGRVFDPGLLARFEEVVRGLPRGRTGEAA